MKKIRLLIFISLLLLASCFSLSLVRKKNSPVEQYLEKYKNADVLVFGSSHAFVNLNGKAMWDEKGIASMCLAQPEQNILLTYYTLDEALKYNKPKLVILESYMATIDDENYLLDEEHYVDALLSFPLIKSLNNRIEVLNIIEKGEDFNYLEYLLGFPIYHSDYYRGTNERNDAGYIEFNEERVIYDNYITYGTKDIDEIIEASSLIDNYYKKIINKCKDESIPLIIINTPYKANADAAKKRKYLENIAKAYDVEYLDMNNYLDDIGFVLSEDLYDDGHATTDGSRKNSIWLANYIFERYNLDNRQVDENYQNWSMID